jgi:prepilin-type N-terminal cleavage/methylation domain-containing protein
MQQGMAQKGLRSGFTLIEILVVLVIMGFLVAMVAPKLSGVVDSAVGTTDDTNQKRLRDIMGVYVKQNNAMPTGLVDMITFTTDFTPANVRIPEEDNGDKITKEFISATIIDRMKPKVHYLNDLEAKELVDMGIKGVFNLARVTSIALAGGQAEPANIEEEMVRHAIVADHPVFMIGVGDSNDDGAIDAAEFAEGNDVVVAGSVVTEGTTPTSVYDATGTTLAATAMADGTLVRFDEGRQLGRIVMGMTNRGDLVQGGMLDEAGVSPKATQRSDYYTWGNYLVILPRLQATMTRLDLDGDGEVKLNAIAIDAESGESVTNKKIVLRTPNTGYPYFIAQKPEDFLTASPEGRTWGTIADSFAVAFQD